MTNKDFFITTWQREAATLAKAFRSLPSEMDKLNFSHHPKFRSSWELVNHIGPHSKEMCQAVEQGKMDLVNEGKFDLNSPSIYKSTEAAALDVEAHAKKLIDLLGACSEEDWMNKQIEVFWGPMKIMTQSLMQTCWMFHFDTVHHLGQLTSYYRVIGTTQPSLMGPTAEEEEAMMAKAN